MRKARMRTQRGVALIIILMLVAIMAAIAATMSERLFTQFKRVGNQINHQQAYWYAIGAEALAQKAIEQSYKDDKDSVNLSQPWAKQAMTFSLDYGTLKGKIVDKQACFNLNALASVTTSTSSAASPYLVQVLQHLIDTTGIDGYQAETIAKSTWSYVSNSQSVQGITGINDSQYESLSPAYLPADGLMADSSEFRAVSGVTGKVMLQLQPLLCTLPSTEWALNVNTIGPEQANLLVALFYPNLSESNAKDLIASRPKKGWTSVSDFMSSSVLAALSEDTRTNAEKYLAIDSAYFGMDAQVFVGESRVRIRSLLFSKDRKTATVIRRRFGGIIERVPDRSSK